MTTDSREIFAIAYRLFERWENVPDGLGVEGQFEWLGAVCRDFDEAYRKAPKVNNTLACDLWSGMLNTIMEQFNIKYPVETRDTKEAEQFFDEYAKKFSFVAQKGGSP